MIRRELAPYLILPDKMHYHYTHLTNSKPYPGDPTPLNILESNVTKKLLNNANDPFGLVFSQDKPFFDTARYDLSPFFYQDRKRSFFIRQEWKDVTTGFDPNQSFKAMKYTFYTFYHPYAELFVRELNRSGLEGLLNRKIQLTPNSFYPTNNFNFQSIYNPTQLTVPDKTSEKDIIDFSFYGAYSIYNWETFFFGPWLIACKLSQNQQFEDAMHWFHFILNPFNTEALGVPQKYWITRPFFEQNSDDYRKQRIERLLENIDENVDQIRAWKNNPFDPHLIARYRPVAYQKAILKDYIGTVIKWADLKFVQNTIESINEAIVLYVLAYELLGPRPVEVYNTNNRDFSYNDLISQGNLDPLGNKKVEVLMENNIPPPPLLVTPTKEGSEPLPLIDISNFCIPHNDILLQYRYMVDDRLYKIRHCMNIEGIKQSLQLYDPPLDLMLLVKAAVAGIDSKSVPGDIEISHGQYRYRILIQKALEFCTEVKNVGEKLLSVLEKRDAEELVLLRSVHEIEMLNAIKKIKENQVSEAKEMWDITLSGLEMLNLKRNYYNSIQYMNIWEKLALASNGLGISAEISSLVLKMTAGASYHNTNNSYW